nr:PREDICTED: jerky protein-like isoform X1 [Latimeria chalumnae]XP_014350816.1 PREDICTED: jerky protein-like isoform X2 [Latimeria chalumnae]|eukprot:XP_014350815.1 PREDICTED: jerky protein-like isoform X1 [Latimeria chalumnae]
MASKKHSRSSDECIGAGGAKRKHITLTIMQKVEILQMLYKGQSVQSLCDHFGVGSLTIYDIKKQCEKLLKFYAESDLNKGIAKRRTMHGAKSTDLDKLLYEWFNQRRSEGVPISGPILVEKAKQFHEELKISEPCEFSTGWLHKFKLRHGIRYLKTSGEKLSADNEATEKYITDFSKLVKDEKLTPEQIYNEDETGLFWRCIPRNTLVGGDETVVSGVKEAKDKLTVLTCANAARVLTLVP